MEFKLPIKRAIEKKFRTKSFKIHLEPSTHRLIIQTAAELMVATATIADRKSQPPVDELRKLIDHTYFALAQILCRLTKDESIQDSELSGFSVDMLPTLGSYTVRVKRWVRKELHRYILHVSPNDNMTVFTRNASTPVIDAGKDRMDEAVDKSFML